MNYLFVGVDVSKDSLDVAIFNADLNKATHLFCTSNDFDGISHAICELKKLFVKADFWFCFEHTGNYQLLLEHQLYQRKLTYSQIPALEIKRSLGITRGKNDEIDAVRIAQYAATHSYKLKSCTPKSDKLQVISSLLSSRQLMVRNNTANKNHLKSLLKTHQSVSVQSCINRIKNQIDSLAMEIESIEKELKQIINSCDSLKTTFQKITAIPGIGLLTACTTILYSDNFTSFTDARKFSSYCGVAPFQYRSGSSIRGKTKTSALRNRQLKKLLFSAATAAIRYDNQLKHYYHRKIDEGKHKMSVKNAVASKLIARMFAVVKRNETYINFAH